MQIIHIANWCTWLAHTLCKDLIWNYKNWWAQPWLSFGILQTLRWSWECIRYFIYLFIFDWCSILFWNFEICTSFLFSFGWWYTLIKNKHQISLYLGLKKWPTFCRYFQMDFLFLKITVFLSVSLSFFLSASFFSVRIVVSSWNFQEWLPMTEVMYM